MTSNRQKYYKEYYSDPDRKSENRKRRKARKRAEARLVKLYRADFNWLYYLEPHGVGLRTREQTTYPRYAKLTSEQDEEVRQMRDTEITWPEIAAHFDVTINTAKAAYRRAINNSQSVKINRKET